MLFSCWGHLCCRKSLLENPLLDMFNTVRNSRQVKELGIEDTQALDVNTPLHLPTLGMWRAVTVNIQQ